MKRIVVSTAVLALACAGLGTANAAPGNGYKVTGGGQILADLGGGAGDTVAVTAQEVGADNEAKGEFQYTPHVSKGAAANGAKFHGDVTCLRVDADRRAIIGGVVRNGDTTEGAFFQLQVVDGDDAGSAMEEMDAVMLQRLDEAPDCSDEAQDEDGPALARGNIKIHDAK